MVNALFSKWSHHLFFCLLIFVAEVVLWLLIHNDVWCFRLHLKQVMPGQSAARFSYLRQLKHNFLELTIFLSSVWKILSFTSVQSLILCLVPSQNTYFRFVAFCGRVLKFLSLPLSSFSFPLTVTGFLSIYRLNASISLGKLHCFHLTSSLTNSDRIYDSFLIFSSDCTCASSF